MDMSNLNKNRNKLRKFIHQTHTPLPHWQRPSMTDIPVLRRNRRKWYAMFAGWVVLIGAALGAGLNHGRCSVPVLQEKTGGKVAVPHEQPQVDSVTILSQVRNSVPKSFRNIQKNEIKDAEYLRPIAEILARGERPLRVLQIGDSHVAGKIFPNEIKANLVKYLGAAESPGHGHGIWFNFIARNGATNQTLVTDAYMNQFAQKHPDLIILSLGTNEAHGMGYREAQHRKELTVFLGKLKSNCPDAVVLMTTPPGDYLTFSYVNYRRTSRSNQKVRQVRRSKKPNPMSAKCAACIVQMGHENQIPVWDMYSICGGAEIAQRNWVAGHYMRPDKIHFMPEGYTVQGRILAEALVNSLAQFKF